ncbi:MAG: two-component response regulator [Labilithrix sp.]|nr:two-component response regulator [Labilithrix sp.]
MTTILAVEDDDDLRDLLSYVLEEQGYSVATAENGLEALSIVRKGMPDLILLDIRMPVMSGAEFANQYLAHYGQALHAPIVVMTAAEHASRRCQEVGANDFLPKPFSTDELVGIVRKYTLSRPPAGAA